VGEQPRLAPKTGARTWGTRRRSPRVIPTNLRLWLGEGCDVRTCASQVSSQTTLANLGHPAGDAGRRESGGACGPGEINAEGAAAPSSLQFLI
jgi:hypothetical protein